MRDIDRFKVIGSRQGVSIVQDLAHDEMYLFLLGLGYPHSIKRFHSVEEVDKYFEKNGIRGAEDE